MKTLRYVVKRVQSGVNLYYVNYGTHLGGETIANFTTDLNEAHVFLTWFRANSIIALAERGTFRLSVNHVAEQYFDWRIAQVELSLVERK